MSVVPEFIVVDDSSSDEDSECECISKTSLISDKYDPAKSPNNIIMADTVNQTFSSTFLIIKSRLVEHQIELSPVLMQELDYICENIYKSASCLPQSMFDLLTLSPTDLSSLFNLQTVDGSTGYDKSLRTFYLRVYTVSISDFKTMLQYFAQSGQSYPQLIKWQEAIQQSSADSVLHLKYIGMTSRGAWTRHQEDLAKPNSTGLFGSLVKYWRQFIPSVLQSVTLFTFSNMSLDQSFTTIEVGTIHNQWRLCH